MHSAICTPFRLSNKYPWCLMGAAIIACPFPFTSADFGTFPFPLPRPLLTLEFRGVGVKGEAQCCSGAVFGIAPATFLELLRIGVQCVCDVAVFDASIAYPPVSTSSTCMMRRMGVCRVLVRVRVVSSLSCAWFVLWWVGWMKDMDGARGRDVDVDVVDCT